MTCDQQKRPLARPFRLSATGNSCLARVPCTQHDTARQEMTVTLLLAIAFSTASASHHSIQRPSHAHTPAKIQDTPQPAQRHDPCGGRLLTQRDLKHIFSKPVWIAERNHYRPNGTGFHINRHPLFKEPKRTNFRYVIRGGNICYLNDRGLWGPCATYGIKNGHYFEVTFNPGVVYIPGQGVWGCAPITITPTRRSNG